MSVVSEETAYWKERYFTLLNEGEKRQTEQNEYENLLNRAVIRLTQAVSGLDAALDPHLRAIREVMRKGENSTLRRELDALLDTLIRTPKLGHPTATTGQGRELLRFLEALCATPEEKAASEAVCRRFEAGGYATEQELFDAAARVLRNRKGSSATGVIGKLFGKGQAATADIDTAKLRRRLDELLRALNLSASLQERLEQLKARVVDDTEDLIALFDAAAALIADMDAGYWQEQKQFGDFLAALSGKLGELEGKALRMDALNQSSAADRRLTEKAVAGEVAGLRADASQATNLVQLRQIIDMRLDTISQRLDSFDHAEEARFTEVQAQVQDLSGRLRTLEQEAEDLRNRLALANQAAYIDPLTKLPNRKAYLERVDLEEKRWRRFQQPLTLAVWDIDFFKKINDRFGHASGDKALAMIGQVLAASIRNTDFVARYGGEEFVMLLLGSDDSNALEIAEGIRQRIEDCEFIGNGKRIAVTVSCGISQFKGRDGFQDVFERADKALYQAKKKGRNRCEIMSPV